MVPLLYPQGTPRVPPGYRRGTAFFGCTAGKAIEEYPRVPVEYPVEYRLSPAAGKAIEDFSQFIEEAEVRCTH